MPDNESHSDDSGEEADTETSVILPPREPSANLVNHINERQITSDSEYERQITSDSEYLGYESFHSIYPPNQAISHSGSRSGSETNRPKITSWTAIKGNRFPLEDFESFLSNGYIGENNEIIFNSRISLTGLHRKIKLCENITAHTPLGETICEVVALTFDDFDVQEYLDKHDTKLDQVVHSEFGNIDKELSSHADEYIREVQAIFRATIREFGITDFQSIFMNDLPSHFPLNEFHPTFDQEERINMYRQSAAQSILLYMSRFLISHQICPARSGIDYASRIRRCSYKWKDAAQYLQEIADSNSDSNSNPLIEVLEATNEHGGTELVLARIWNLGRSSAREHPLSLLNLGSLVCQEGYMSRAW